MATSRPVPKKALSQKHNARPLKRKRDEEDIATLAQRVQDLGSAEQEIKAFTDLPLSQPTSKGLEASHFKTLTDIQQKAVPLAFKGKDILGAAKTGSGKTLAFLVPVLENLYRKRWTELDGLGALILSPTRELAIQIFEVLRKIGRYHTFSAGLVIGGKSLQEERERLGRMNILVCTPGRILQHMDQTAAFEIDNLQMLVLDEADRILDMGFQNTVDAIVEHLPKERQTLLFSATQTKKVSDLARLSLRDPEYVSVHEQANSATPTTLQQHYIITPLPEKLDTLWSFIRANVKSKILVFLSSGKQVRFVYEGFRHLQPGIPLLHLHGRQKQTARLDITTRFAATKNACLFATDVVARGLDFPAVDWVIQLDCPEDADTYIHRVGRTARYERDGRAVLFLEPSEEEGMLKRLEQKKVPIEMIKVKQKKQQSIRTSLQNMCFKDPEIKYLGQKAFVSYVRSVHIQKDKEIFKINELPLEEFSASMGLPGAPRIKFQKGDNIKERKNASRQVLSSSDDEDGQPKSRAQKKEPEVRTKYDRMFERRNQDVLADHYTKLINEDKENNDDEADLRNGDADADEGFLTVKRRLSNASSNTSIASLDEQLSTVKHRSVPVANADPLLIDSKRREKLLKSKKAMLRLKGKGNKLVFDEAGNAHEVYELEDEEAFQARGAAEEQRAQFLETEGERIRMADVDDKAMVKEKRRERKEKKKEREREAVEGSESEGENYEETGPVLVPLDEVQADDGEEEEEGERPVKKRAKKWFEDASDDNADGNPKKGTRKDAAEPETLEDLEALASGLLR
ncbi:ATP-dependent RNA helicase dbp4 [Ptychographa xylographoides]|nr:ATP-dependent RNA helicase dbp4 [Ptychographa xylographoides]